MTPQRPFISSVTRRFCNAFTLIELLVVITIIVVLLALLTPALDKAIQQAELAACSAQLKGHHSAATSYAAGNQRRYPDRSPPKGQSAYWMNSIGWPTVQWDLRTLMEDYMSPKLHNDPMSPSVDFTVDESGNDNTFAYSNYSIFYGFEYAIPGASGMTRLGKKWTIDADDRLEGTKVNFRFGVMAGDFEYDTGLPGGSTGNQVILTSHPDADGKGVEEVLQDASSPASAAIQGRADGDFTLSRWVINEPGIPTRGTLEQSFVMVDGGVERFNDVEQLDERFLYVPLAETGAFFIQIPKR